MIRRGLARVRRLAWHKDTHGWGATAILFVLAAHAIRYALSQGRMPHGDGFYTWIFTRSLAFDFDLDLTNDYALCGDPFKLGIDEGGGRPGNPLYFGPAVILAPVLWVVRHVIHLRDTAPVTWLEGCEGPYVSNTGIACIAAVGCTMWLGYRVARRWFPEKPSALAVVIVGLGSPLATYGSLTWYYSHLWAAFAVAVALVLSVRAWERPELRARWLLAGCGIGFAALMRAQEAFWAFVPLVAVGVLARRERAPRELAIRLALLALGFAVAYAPQLVVYEKLYGTPWAVPQGKTYVQLGHAHPFLLLFSARSGFVYWTPLMWVPLLGAARLLWRRPTPLAPAITLAMAVSVYVASAALAWTGSGTLGARVQTSLAAGLIVSGAAALEPILSFVRRRARAGSVVTLAIAPLLAVTWFIPDTAVAIDRPVPAPELYGPALTFPIAWTYERIGNPCILPASLAFSLRYGVPMNVFDRLASEGMWRRHYRTLVAEQAVLDFGSPPDAYWSEGMPPGPGGGVVVDPGRRARFLVAIYWPWTTRLRVRARPLDGRPVRLALRANGRALAPSTFAEDATFEMAVPAGAFDSGINEVELEADAKIGVLHAVFLDDLRHDTSVRLLSR